MNLFKERYKEELPQKGYFLTTTAESLPFVKDMFDVCICVNALDHMHSPEIALKEIKRVLKPKGFFLVGLFCRPYLLAILKKVGEMVFPFCKEKAHPYEFYLSSMENFVKTFFEIKLKICTHYRKRNRTLHREDWMFVCKNA